MKRLTIFLMMFLYVVSVSGVTVVRHFCGGRLSSVSVKLLAGNHKCSCGKKKMKKGCCKNEHVQVKVKCEHKAIGEFSVSKCSYKVISFQIPVYKQLVTNVAPSPVSNHRGPPPKSNNSRLAFHSIFRI